MRDIEQKRRLGSTWATLFLSLFFSSVAFLGCSPEDPEAAKAEIRQTTGQFFSALAAGDLQTISELAPGLNLGEEEASQLAEALGEPPNMEEAEVRLDGSRAYVDLAVNRAEGSSAQLTVPLRNRQERWIIDGSLEVTQSYDFVPLEDEL